jgi:hypothetical protein
MNGLRDTFFHSVTHTEFLLGNQFESNTLKDQEGDGKIILRWSSVKFSSSYYNCVCMLDLSLSQW